MAVGSFVVHGNIEEIKTKGKYIKNEGMIIRSVIKDIDLGILSGYNLDNFTIKEKFIINESFNNPLKISWNGSNATFSLDGDDYRIEFEDMYDQRYRVQFGPIDENGEISFDTTNKNKAPIVFATVILAIKEFINKRKPQSIQILSKNKRESLYNRIVKSRESELDSMGYTWKLAEPEMGYSRIDIIKKTKKHISKSSALIEAAKLYCKNNLLKYKKNILKSSK